MPRLTLETPADVRLLDSGMSVGEALAAFNAAHPDAGGIATFLGKVRPDDDVRVLELTHYEPLTLPGMRELADEALTPREAFIACRLGRLFQAAAEQHRQHGGLLLNYSELPQALGGSLRAMFGLDAVQVGVALQGSGQNAKRPEQAFAADIQHKRDGASASLREAVSRWAEAPYQVLETLRLRQLG
mgnify:CR=1 FL=1